ncbi:MAG: M48 family metallopeptidase [Chloroflexi bacterium]|nr:M48 family metallopeptidase [Chloroflexota bacterium]
MSRTPTPTPPIERPIRLELPGGPVDATLRASTRARRLRLSVDHRRGLVVTVPVAGGRGRARPPDDRVMAAAVAFAAEREAWIRRHVAAVERARAAEAARGPLGDGSVLPYRGEPHVLRVADAAPRRRSSVARVGGEEGDEIHVALAARDADRLGEVLERWLRTRAGDAIDRAAAMHARALGVTPAAVTIRDQRTRWGSASRSGRISLSWRLVLAPPEALETVVVHELAHLRVFGHPPEFWALVASRVPEHRTWRRWLRQHAAELHGVLAEEG